MDQRNIAVLVTALVQAEEKLQFVITESAKDAHYAVSKAASAVAESIREIRDRLTTKDEPPTSPSPRSSSASQMKIATHAARRPAYPRFYRRGDQLIRVAYSRRGKKEYSHKAPRTVLELMAAAMSELGKDGRVLTTDQLLPMATSDGNAVPDYQSYVCIAFLKEAGLIDQHGRQGYSIPRLAQFKESVISSWHNLSEQ